jgi:uridine kinase
MAQYVNPDEAVAVVAKLAAGRNGSTLFVGIDGPGGAGKSTLAARLATAVDGAVVAVDDFAGPQVPEWDWARFQRQVVEPLRADRPAHYQRWDWDRDEGAEWHDVTVGSVVIVEGVSATRRELDVAWALTIWVQTAPEIRRARAIERDGAARFQLWTDVWIPSEQAYIRTQDPLSWIDLIVPGSDSDAGAGGSVHGTVGESEVS